MERKLNAFHKPKSKSQQDLFKGDKNIDDHLHELATLSGVNFDKEVFNIVIDLLKLNVNPNTILDILKKMAQQKGMRPSKSSDDIARQNRKSASEAKMKMYASYLETGQQ